MDDLSMPPSVLLLDVNETLLDIKPLQKAVAEVLLSEDAAKQVLSVIRKLPPHPDVMPALDRLRTYDIRLAALTNSSQEVAEAQMKHVRLDGFFERILSVEHTRHFKPHRAVYDWATGQMGVAPGQCMLVAAYGWDIAGAQWAGLRAAFIAREGQQMFPLAEKPDVDASDLLSFAEKLISTSASKLATPGPAKAVKFDT